MLPIQPILRLFSNRADTSRRSQRKKRSKEQAPNANVPLQITLFLSGYIHQLISRNTLEAPLYGSFLAPLLALQDW